MRKKGISLIVLSITILVMAILAATAIIALEDSGIIGRSKNTTTKQNEQQEYTRLQVIKNGILTDNLGEITVDEYINELKGQGVIEDTVATNEYGNTVVKTKSGLEVYIKQDGKDNIKISFEAIQPGLGDLITADNYGESVDYEVTVNGITYGSWRIYYHNEDYVFLIAGEAVDNTSLDAGTMVSDLTSKEKELYRIFQVGNWPKFTLKDTINGITAYNSQGVAQLIKDYGEFANTMDYGNNVIGAIGGPTIELLVAGWNACGFSPKISLTIDNFGYYFDNDISNNDCIYTPFNYGYWVASTYYGDEVGVVDACGYIGGCGLGHDNNQDVRPVVCLKASIPAAPEGDGADWGLIK